jgi:(p)ppGpp synthase/HD superfamily hydrolase
MTLRDIKDLLQCEVLSCEDDLHIDVTQVVAEAKVNIVAANVSVTPDRTAVVHATLQVASVAQLARVMSKLEQLKDIISVSRDLS